MKRLLILKLSIVLVIVFLLSAFQVNAAVDKDTQDTAAGSLVKLQIMYGDENGNLNLDNKVKRCEFVALVNRMLGYDADIDVSDVDMSKYKDISKKHWAYNTIKIAVKYNFLSGYTDNTIRPDAYVNYVEAQAILLRALNYENTLKGEWPSNVLDKAAELGLNKNIDLPSNKELTRGEASVLIYNSLTISFNI